MLLYQLTGLVILNVYLIFYIESEIILDILIFTVKLHLHDFTMNLLCTIYVLYKKLSLNCIYVNLIWLCEQLQNT